MQSLRAGGLSCGEAEAKEKMRFYTHGDEKHRKLMLIHGMGNSAALFDPVLPYLRDFYVIVCELDGHSRDGAGDFISVEAACEKTEDYINSELSGELYGMLGFSLGATIALELISRGRVKVARTILDAPYTVKMGLMTLPFKWMFQGAVWCVKKDIPIPGPMIEAVMGKGNRRIINAITKDVSLTSIGNACMSLYTYDIKKGLRLHEGPVVIWYGSNEKYPAKSARLIKGYLPRLKRRVFRNMGHGQVLNENPYIYARRITEFMEEEQG